jgi:diguanylate cyclase (GGDEF)-like protein/PAS domain S-box-containing protein
MSVRNLSIRRPATLVQRWHDGRRHGGYLPTYESVVLGRLGRLADCCALVATSECHAPTIAWTGPNFAEWLENGRSDISLRQLPDETREPLEGIVTAALRTAEPALARSHRVVDGVVISHHLTGVPLVREANGERVVLLHVEPQGERTELARAVFGASKLGMLAIAALKDEGDAIFDFKIVALNDGAARMLGQSAAELQWRRLSEIVPKRSGHDPVRGLVEALSRSDQTTYELSYPRSDGTLLHLKVEAGAVGDLVALTIADVGDIKEREASFRLLFDHNPMPMWLSDPETGRFAAINEAAIAHFGHERDVLLSLSLKDVSVPGPATADGEAVVRRQRRADGGVIDVTLFERALTFEGRSVRLGAAVDITESRRNAARIAHMAHHDALTGLPNRTRFADRLAEAIGRQKRGAGSFVLLCLDLDKFKIVNDTLGHPVGDALLCEAGARLAQCVREEDCVARLGGDEFAVLVATSALPDAIRSLCDRIIGEMGRCFSVAGHNCHVGTSIGVACLGQDGDDTDTLLRNADLALYRAKATGGNSFCCFKPEMDAWVQARRKRENDLREALVRGEFALVYQPQLSSVTGRICGFEALLRWHHPIEGLVSPAEFIPLAEETGLINPIGTWVLREACSEAAGWPGALRIAVNLSPIQFRNRDLVGSVRDALKSSGLAPERLELEITEGVLLADNEANLSTLHELRALGVRIAMDDFGTGYSSLSYLRSFPFDKIKIDRSFVSQVGESLHCTAIVRAVTGLAASLGIITTAEGVETAAQLAHLKAEGCHEVQGFLFSKPIRAAEVTDLLNDLRRENTHFAA